MTDLSPCHCGHSVEEHGHDPKYPGSTACTAERCDCIAYESDGSEDEENEYEEYEEYEDE